MCSNTTGSKEYYSLLSIFLNNQRSWSGTNCFIPDYVSGLCVAGFLLLKDYHFNVTIDTLTISQLEDINKLSSQGGYISFRNRTTTEALKCVMSDDDTVNCEYRCLTPDDGTTAIWIFDHNEDDGPRWNLIMTDNIKAFVTGFDFMCKLVGANMWNYILGPPIGSEGGVSNWNLLMNSDYL